MLQALVSVYLTYMKWMARALLEWHNLSRFGGNCGAKAVPMEAGRRKQCVNELCKKRFYPRVDPVVIMLVIDNKNDRALLSRQSRYVPRMWSCLAGFIEPGESLEEAVRRETWEENGIEVGEVVYHSSQPWPAGPSSMPCQLMVGFFAYAKSFEIHVEKEELEDAKWHSREDIKKALTYAEYKKAQRTSAAKVEQMCKGVEKGQLLSADFNIESGELAPMFIQFVRRSGSAKWCRNTETSEWFTIKFVDLETESKFWKNKHVFRTCVGHMFPIHVLLFVWLFHFYVV